MNKTRRVLRAAISEALEKHPHFSNRRIAEEITKKVGKVSHVTIGKHRQRLNLMTGFVTGRDHVSRARPLTPGLQRDLQSAFKNLRRQIIRVSHLQPTLCKSYHSQLWQGRSNDCLTTRQKEFETLRSIAAAGIREINETFTRILPPPTVTS